MEPIEVTGKTVAEAVQAGLSSLGLSKDQVQVEVIDEGSRGFLGLVGFRHARVRMRALETAQPATGNVEPKNGQPNRTSPGPRVPSASKATPEGDPSVRRGEEPWIPARRVTVDRDEEDPSLPNTSAVSYGAKFLEGLVSVMGLDAEVYETEADDITMLEVEGKSLGVLIGRHGETLDSIQYLVNLSANRALRASGDEEHARYVVDVAGYRKKREETLRAMASEAADRVICDKKKQILEPMSALERRIVHVALKDVEGVVTHSEGREPYRRIVISPSE